MFSKEILSLLIQVVRSWQVIAITVAIVLYISLVSYVARMYHSPRFTSKTSKRKKKKGENAEAAPAAAGPVIEDSSNEELGLEEK